MINALRNVGFWVADTVQNRTIGKALRNLELIGSMDSLDGRMVEYQMQYLEKILRHATATTNFYEDIEVRLDKFPVVNKNIIKKQYDSFLSKKYSAEELVTMETSGSTGMPFTCFQNIDKKKRVYAEVIYYCGQAGYRVGRKIIYLRALTPKSQKSKAKQWLQNESLIDCSELSDTHLSKIISRIEKNSKGDGALLLGYPSTYQALLESVENQGIDYDFNIYGIVSSSELLHDNLREKLTNTFNCECFSRYANEENGLLGQDTPKNPNQFIINEAHYYIEVLHLDSDVAVEEGEVGRIVVTDLYNYGMPMIRYDTGDIGAISYIEHNGIRKKVITNFGGRKIDVIYDTKGNRISPFAINNNLSLFPEVGQYQFIQADDRTYILKIVADVGFCDDDKVRDSIVQIVGCNADIRIERVKQISKLPSGKHQYIINHHIRDQ